MSEFSFIERLIHKVKIKIIEPLFAPFRRKKLTNTDFTIISNNCWGGRVYEYFGLRKNSPTIGAYFFPTDFIAFVRDLKYYTSKPIQMISAEESKWYEQLKFKGQLKFPIGRIDGIEVVFLHYQDPTIAKEKWERRCKRINWNNIIYKFSYMNGCTDKDIREFDDLTKDKKRVIFTRKKIKYVSDCIIIPPAFKNDDVTQITNDTFYFDRYVDLVKMING